MKFINKIKNVFSNYKCTYITSIIIGFLLMFNEEIESSIYSTLLFFFITFGVICAYSETLLNKDKRKLNYLLAIILSFIIALISNIDGFIENIYFIKIIICLYSIFPILTIYTNYKNNNKSFSKYMINVFSNLIETGITYMVLLLGGMLILSLIDLLIYKNIFDNLYDKYIISISFFYFLPSIINNFHEYKDTNKFINILVSKVLFILVLIAYVVIYVYIFKIIITLTLPSNMIFRIVSILFVLSLPISIMSESIQENDILKKINNILPYIFVPLMMLQVYSLFTRIWDYGITIVRYVGLVLIIIELIYIALKLFKKDNSLLLPIISIIIFIVTFIPFFNFYDASINSQYNILKEYKTNYRIDKRISGAYDYLSMYKEGQTKIDKLLSPEEKSKINNYNSYYNDETEKVNYLNYNYDKEINIEGYKTLKKHSIYKYNNDENDDYYYQELSKCIFDGNKNKCIDKGIEKDNSKFIVIYLFAEYTDNEIIHVSADGYLLEK